MPKLSKDEVLKNRNNLCTLLRDKSLWPKDFKWDFGTSSGCAIGLSSRIYSGLSPSATINVQEFLGLSLEDAIRCFSPYVFNNGQINHELSYEDSYRQITPEMVAERISQQPICQ